MLKKNFAVIFSIKITIHPCMRTSSSNEKKVVGDEWLIVSRDSDKDDFGSVHTNLIKEGVDVHSCLCTCFEKHSLDRIRILLAYSDHTRTWLSVLSMDSSSEYQSFGV